MNILTQRTPPAPPLSYDEKLFFQETCRKMRRASAGIRRFSCVVASDRFSCIICLRDSTEVGLEERRVLESNCSCDLLLCVDCFNEQRDDPGLRPPRCPGCNIARPANFAWQARKISDLKRDHDAVYGEKVWWSRGRGKNLPEVVPHGLV